MKVLLRNLQYPDPAEETELPDGSPLAALLAQRSCSAVIVERWGTERWRYTVAGGPLQEGDELSTSVDSQDRSHTNGQ